MLSPQQKKAIKETLAAIVICAFVGAAIRLVIPRSYSSSAALLFPGATSQVGAVTGTTGQASGMAPSAGGADQPALPLMQGVLNVPQPGTSPATAGLIIKSRQTTDELIRRFDLQKVWRTSYERAVERLDRDLQCIAGSSGDLRVVYTDTSPERAHQIANAAIKILTISIEKLSLDPASKNLRFLKESLAKAERDCIAAQKALVNYQKSIGGASPDSSAQSLAQVYSNIHEELINMQAELAALMNNEAKARQLNGDMIRVGQDPTNSEKSLLSIIYYKISDDERNLQALRQKYTDKQPQVVMAKKQLEVDRASLRKEIERQSKGLRTGASPFISQTVISNAATKAKIKELEDGLTRVQNQLKKLPEAQAEYGQLTLNLRDERSRLSLIRSEYVKAQLIAQSRGPQFVVLDKPAIPLKPNGKGAWFYAGIGALVGLLVVGGKWLVIGLKQSLE